MLTKIILKQIMQNITKILEFFESKGVTKITTSENYIINGKDIIFDNKNNIISSNESAVLTPTL